MILTFKEVIEAAWIDTRFPDDGGDAGGVKTLLVEELECAAENALPGFRLGLCFELSVHSSVIERLLKYCQELVYSSLMVRI